jgi:NAD(P)H-nitrite reductase large subunit
MDIIYTLIVLLLLNCALYFGQECYYNADTKKLQVLEKTIDSQKRTYIRLELQLNDISKAAEKFTNQAEFEHLHKKYDDITRIYKKTIQSHNDNVEEYNKLIKSCGSRWYIIPIPGRSKGRYH